MIRPTTEKQRSGEIREHDMKTLLMNLMFALMFLMSACHVPHHPSARTFKVSDGFRTPPTPSRLARRNEGMTARDGWAAR